MDVISPHRFREASEVARAFDTEESAGSTHKNVGHAAVTQHAPLGIHFFSSFLGAKVRPPQKGQQ